MPMNRPSGVLPISNRQLMHYTGSLVIGLLIVHGFILLAAGGRITLLAALLLAVIAVYVAAFAVRNSTALRIRPYGLYFTHALAYLIVTGSFWLHAWLLALSGHRDTLDQGWSAFLVSMSALWGLGLVVHTIGAVLSKGYEDAEFGGR
jgi:hypothetical protein